jgi:type IV secretory pathway TrbD component
LAAFADSLNQRSFSSKLAPHPAPAVCGIQPKARRAKTREDLMMTSKRDVAIALGVANR